MDADVSALVARVRRSKQQRAVVEALLPEIQDPLLLLIHVWLAGDDGWVKLTVDSHDGQTLKAHAVAVSGVTLSECHICFLGRELTRELTHTVVADGGDIILEVPWRFM